MTTTSSGQAYTGAPNSADHQLSMDELAAVTARDIPAGAFVNLGIGQPTKIADHLPADSGVVLHTEYGMLNMGPKAEGDAVDPGLTNAGKVPVTERPSGESFVITTLLSVLSGVPEKSVSLRESEQQMIDLIPRRVPLEQVLRAFRAGNEQLAEAYISACRRLAPPDHSMMRTSSVPIRDRNEPSSKRCRTGGLRLTDSRARNAAPVPETVAPTQPGPGRHGGTVVGSVSGGCVEAAVYELCQQVLAHGGPPARARFGYLDGDARTAIRVLTHDAKFDIPLLRLALTLPAGYIGAVGSRRTHERRIDLLREAGIPENQPGRLNSPIGLDLGARTYESPVTPPVTVNLLPKSRPMRPWSCVTVQVMPWKQPSPGCPHAGPYPTVTARSGGSGG